MISAPPFTISRIGTNEYEATVGRDTPVRVECDLDTQNGQATLARTIAPLHPFFTDPTGVGMIPLVDAIEELRAGRNDAGTVPTRLREVLRNAAESAVTGKSVESLEPAPVLIRLSDVEAVPVRWLWPGRIAIGKVTMLAGDPGLGKSFMTLDMAARITTGTPWPDSPTVLNPVGGVVLLRRAQK